MSKLVTIYGGSGFVGRYVARRMAQQGWRVRVAVRRPNEALFVRSYGAVGQVEPVLCNIRDDASVRAAARGADAVVYSVGSFAKGGKNNFDAVQKDGAARVARIAAEEAVGQLVHISAIGADAAGDSLYARSKGAGEDAVLAAFPGAVILRPSAIFGSGDGFFNKFGALARLLPIIPITHGNSKLQPVYVDDVAEAAARAAAGDAAPGIYELGGPQVLTLRETLVQMLPVIQRRRLVLSLPAALMRVPAFFLDLAETLSARLFRNTLITGDQITMLSHDNVASGARPGLKDLGIEPTAMEAVLAEYLWPYRPSGQYAAIKQSAKNLKKV